MIPVPRHFNRKGSLLGPQKVPRNQLQASTCPCNERGQTAASSHADRTDSSRNTSLLPSSSQLGGDALHLKAFTDLPPCWKQWCLISWFAVKWSLSIISSYVQDLFAFFKGKAMLGEDASIFKLLPKDNSIFSSDRLSQLGARNIPPSNSVLQLNPDAVNPQTQEPGTTFQKAELMWVKGRKLVEDHEQVRGISSKRNNIFRWQEKDNEETSFPRLNQFTFLENVHRLWGLGWKNIK